MSDRISALTVVLQEDLREDDAEPIIEAIKQLRGVIAVRPQVADIVEFTAQQRVRNQLWDTIVAVFFEGLRKPPKEGK